MWQREGSGGSTDGPYGCSRVLVGAGKEGQGPTFRALPASKSTRLFFGFPGMSRYLPDPSRLCLQLIRGVLLPPLALADLGLGHGLVFLAPGGDWVHPGPVWVLLAGRNFSFLELCICAPEM